MSGEYRYAEPWDRQEGESEKYYAWFKTFLDMGRGRSFTQVHRTRDDVAEYHQVLYAAKKWNWKVRAAARDKFRDDKLLAETVEAIAEAEGHIVSQYAHMVMLHMQNTINQLESGKLNSAINNAVKDMANRIGHIRPERVELQLGPSEDDKTSVKKRFLDNEEQRKLAQLLKNIGAYDDIEPDPEAE